MRFLTGGKWVTCCGSKCTNSLGRKKLHNSLRETTSRTFNSHMIRSCSTKPRQIHEPAGVKQMISSPFFKFCVGRYNKTLNDWPRRKQWWILFPLRPQEFCFPKTSRVFLGKQNSLFPMGGVNNPFKGKVKSNLPVSIGEPATPLYSYKTHQVIFYTEVASCFSLWFSVHSMNRRLKVGNFSTILVHSLLTT